MPERKFTALLPFVLGGALLVGLKFWLVFDDEVVARAIPHDHQRYAEMAAALIRGEWLGDYDHMTLIREPSYPIWIAAVHATGIPMRWAAEILLVAASVLFAMALRRSGLPWAPALACLGLLVFQPHSLLVNRELLAAGFYLPVMLAAISGLLLCVRSELTRWRWRHAAWAGLALGVLWTTRPEKPLVAGLLIAGMGFDWVARRARGSSWREAARASGMPVAIGILGIGLITTMLAGLNARHYGLFRTSDLSAPGFAAANSALQRIDHASPRRFVLVPREVRRHAYAVSPAFGELRSHLETQGWGRAVSCRVVQVCDDYAGAWFMWTMREAAAKAGRMGSAPEADAFFQRIADEIGAARARGALPPERRGLGFLHPYPETYRRYLGDSLQRVARRMGMPGDAPDWDLPRDLAAIRAPIKELFDDVASRRSERTSMSPVRIEGRATAAGDPIERISLRRPRWRGADRASDPELLVEIASVSAHPPRDQLSFRFDVEKLTEAFRSVPVTVEFVRQSGATTRLPLPRAGESVEADGILLGVDAVVEGETGSAARRWVRRWLWRTHAWLIRGLTLAGGAALLFCLWPPWRRILADPLTTALVLILSAVSGRVFMLTLVDASSFPTWSSRYVYPVVSLYSCGALILVVAAVRHWKSGAGPQSIRGPVEALRGRIHHKL